MFAAVRTKFHESESYLQIAKSRVGSLENQAVCSLEAEQWIAAPFVPDYCWIGDCGEPDGKHEQIVVRWKLSKATGWRLLLL